MGRRRKNPIRKTDSIRVVTSLPSEEYLQFLQNLPGKFLSVSDALRSFIREFNRKCEGEG